MLFPTLGFLVFLLVVLAACAPLARANAARKAVLTAASYWFYAQWNWKFCGLLAASSALTWAGGLGIAGAQTEAGRRAWVAGAVATHLGLLGFFKYLDFATESLNRLGAALGLGAQLPGWEILLPVGISFFTFHGISYLVDVYRRDVAVCRNPLDILLYLSFFPQLVAGPIVRSSDFLPQLARPPAPRVEIALPVLLILGGLFKKVVVANGLATRLVDPVFFDPSRRGALDRLAATYGYAVQIYADFSAYTDIAIGLAALLGYRFPVNFDQPYRAASLREFWRRWHISLSSWLRDYLYKPLGGSRGSEAATMRNLMIVMLLGGIWHGAAWKFAAWGALHGAGLAVERKLGRLLWPRERLGRLLGAAVVLHVVCLGWILFRADGIETAAAFFGPAGDAETVLAPWTLGLIALGFALNWCPPGLPRRLADACAAWPAWVWGVLAAAGVLAIDAMGPEGVAPFIYFQF